MEAASPDPAGADPDHAHRWRPGLDGMRAIAVLAVLAYHEPNVGLRGGFLGVDLFFVLSGFLITGLLLDEHHRHGSVSLRSFWDRRARRLLAALAVLLPVVLIAVTIISDDASRRALPGAIGAAVLYVSNWQLISGGVSYFDQFRSLSPLQHLWSVAIEEQFYLVWPIVVIVALRWRRSALVVVTMVAIAASVTAMALLAHSPDPSRAYFGTDTRVFALLVGALGALLAWRLEARSKGWTAVGLVSIVVIAIAMAIVGDTDLWMYRGGFLVFAIVALVLTIVASDDNTVTRALSHRWLRRIGEFSYALYLWHWPVRVLASDSELPFADDFMGNVAATLTRLALTVVLAVASTLLVERAVRRSRFGVSVLGPAWLGLGAVVVVVSLLLLPPGGTRIVGLDTASSDSPPSAAAGSGGLLLVGDSMAMTLIDGLVAELPPGTPALGAGRIGCALLVSNRLRGRDDSWATGATGCPSHDDEWRSLIAQDSPSVVMLLAGAWDIYARDWGNGPTIPGDAEFDRHYRETLDATIAALTSGGAQAVILSTPCFAPPPGSEANNGQHPERSAALVAVQRAAVADANRRRPDSVVLVDLNSISCDGGFTRRFDGVEWRPDGTHFSMDGSRAAARWILSQLPAATRARLGSNP